MCLPPLIHVYYFYFPLFVGFHTAYCFILTLCFIFIYFIIQIKHAQILFLFWVFLFCFVFLFVCCFLFLFLFCFLFFFGFFIQTLITFTFIRILLTKQMWNITKIRCFSSKKMFKKNGFLYFWDLYCWILSLQL